MGSIEGIRETLYKIYTFAKTIADIIAIFLALGTLLYFILPILVELKGLTQLFAITTTILATILFSISYLYYQQRKFNNVTEELPGLYFYLKKLRKDIASKVNDNNHFYTLKSWTFKIKNSSCIFIIHLKGLNQSRNKEATNFIPLKISGHSPMDVNKMEIIGEDLKTGQRLPPPEVIHNGDYLKCFLVKFNSPLKYNDYFEIEVRCHWDMLFPKKNAYALMTTKHMPKGCDECYYEFNFDSPITSTQFFQLRRMKLISVALAVILSEDKKTLTWIEKNPKLDFVHIFRFSRE